MCDLLQKLELLHAAGTQITPSGATELVKTFYEILTILDGKGLALLAFDGIIVAATTFVAEKGDVFRKRGLARWLAILVIVIALLPQLCASAFPKSLIRFSTMLHAAGRTNWITPTR